MLLKQTSLFLIFVTQGVIGGAGYVVDDGKSPPQTLKPWLPEENFKRLNERYQPDFVDQGAQRRNSNAPVYQQARSTYFDSHSSVPPAAPPFRQAQGRQRAINTPHQEQGTYQDFSLFQQGEGRNFGSPFRRRHQSRTPFEQHQVIDAHSPISKLEKGQHLLWGNNNDNHEPNIGREQISARFGGEDILDDLHEGYQRHFFRGEDFKSTPVNGRLSNKVQRGRDRFLEEQHHAHVNHREFDDAEPEFYVGERDYSHEITHEGNEEEIRYESPFTDDGASNDQLGEYYDFFSDQGAFKNNAQYYSLEVEGDQKTSIIHPDDFEADFSNDPDFSVEETHATDTHELFEEQKTTRLTLDSFEVGFDNSSTKKKNPVRSLEALESQEYNSKKIKTIYRVSRGKDTGGIYPVITSVQTNIEDKGNSESEGKNLQVSHQSTRNRKSFKTTQSGEEEPPSTKQNRRGEEIGPSSGLQDSRYSKQIENNQDGNKRTTRHSQHHHVPAGYTKHGQEHMHPTNEVPIYYPKVYKDETIVITNPPEIHQTVEVHHQQVSHHPDESIVSIQSPPGAFVEVPHYVPGVHDLSDFIDTHQHQQQPYLEVNIPKHKKVHKIRRGYIYELHLTDDEHLHQKEIPYHHYRLGHH